MTSIAINSFFTIFSSYKKNRFQRKKIVKTIVTDINNSSNNNLVLCPELNRLKDNRTFKIEIKVIKSCSWKIPVRMNNEVNIDSIINREDTIDLR